MEDQIKRQYGKVTVVALSTTQQLVLFYKRRQLGLLNQRHTYYYVFGDFGDDCILGDGGGSGESDVVGGWKVDGEAHVTVLPPILLKPFEKNWIFVCLHDVYNEER